VTDEDRAVGLVYPPFTRIRKISAVIATAVAERSYELGKPSVILKFPYMLLLSNINSRPLEYSETSTARGISQPSSILGEEVSGAFLYGIRDLGTFESSG
jgi:hypothetical protein